MDTLEHNKHLRFGCPACGIRLVVDLSIAGTEGPCPSCGAHIVAPALEDVEKAIVKEADSAAVEPLLAGDVKLGHSQPEQRREDTTRASQDQKNDGSQSGDVILIEEDQSSQKKSVYIKLIVLLLVLINIAIAAYFILNNAG